MPDIELKNLVKTFGPTQVIRDVSLKIGTGEFAVLVGPSGSGKSTLLRMIAGLEEITGGTCSIDGKVVNHVPPKKRGVAMVFQNYALYPHMTVFDNLAFALKVQGLGRAEIAERVRKVAGIVEMEDYLRRKPAQLSGGQRQRVAMARAMVRNTGLFLLDEPLSNLDAKLRTQMRVEIRRLHDRLGATSVYVTHDQTEAMTLADRIVVLNDGRIEQVGTPDELYENPRTLFVAGFLGSPPMNFLPGTMLGLGGDVTVGVRPEKLRLERRRGDDLRIEAKLELVEYLGSSALFHCSAAGVQLVVETQGEGKPRTKPGSAIDLFTDTGSLHRYPANEGGGDGVVGTVGQPGVGTDGRRAD